MANDFTVADVLEWARTKPADERYCYTSPCGCALSQYLMETGRAVAPKVVPYAWREGSSLDYHQFSNELELALLGTQRVESWTFGALVSRLEAIVQETPANPSPWLSPQTYLDADCGEHVW